MDDYASPWKGLIWVGLAVFLAALFAFGLAPFVRMIPWSWERTMASAIDITPDDSCHPDSAAKAAFAKLTGRLYPLDDEERRMLIDVQIVKNPQVNAIALPGGHIEIYSGLLDKAQSADEVAGILAHEMTHERRRHVLQGLIVRLVTGIGFSMIFSPDEVWKTDLAKYFATMTFTRGQEEEADEGAMLRLQKAHIDNKGFHDFFERMEKSSAAARFLSDHPANEDRAALADQYPVSRATPVMTSDEWKALKHYCH